MFQGLEYKAVPLRKTKKGQSDKLVPQNQINLVLQGGPLGQTLLTRLKDVVADCNAGKRNFSRMVGMNK